MRKIFLNCIWILPCAVALGLALVALSLLFPPADHDSRVLPAADIIRAESPYPLETYSQRMLDNDTDSLMLLEAADAGEEGLLDRAIHVYYTAERGRVPNATLVDQLPPGTVETYRHSYARYWHGFMVFLRPAFALLGYNGIRTLNLALQHALLMALLLLIQRRCPSCLFPFLLTVLFLAPTAIGKSLQFSSVYYLILLECLLLLWNPKGLLRGDRAGWLFLFSGIAVAYLDLLTWPTAALTLPLVLLCAREYRERGAVRESLRRLGLCALLWFVGYAGMWAGKWLLALLFDGGQFLTSLLEVMSRRTSATNGFQTRVSRGRCLWVNLRTLFENRHLLILTVFYMLSQMVLLLRRKSADRAPLRRLSVFLLPALIAVGWILLLSNHATVHSWFTYRTLAPGLFSLLTFLSVAAAGDGEKENGSGA